MSRSGAADESTTALIEECHNAGVNVVIQKGSVLSIGDIQNAVALAGPRTIRGVIQGAMVLKVGPQLSTTVSKYCLLRSVRTQL